MVWENTKLLLRLFYRPVAAMSGIIDQGHWLYGAIVVAALGMGFQATVSLHIYESYEAVYRKLEKPPVQEPEESTEEAQVTPSESHVESTAASQQVTREQFLQARKLGLNPPTPTFTFDRHPLPLVGKYGWWFVSFEPTSFFGSLIGMAVLYIPCLILLAAMTGSVGSFNVVLRRDYGPLLTCALMAWAAAHLPFTLASLPRRPHLVATLDLERNLLLSADGSCFEDAFWNGLQERLAAGWRWRIVFFDSSKTLRSSVALHAVAVSPLLRFQHVSR
jgi:hypothetical protein